MMMTTIKLIMMTAATFVFTACGSGEGDKTNLDTTNLDTITMEIGTPYTMNAGQAIVRNSHPTVVAFETDIVSGVTIATLQSGSATIE